MNQQGVYANGRFSTYLGYFLICGIITTGIYIYVEGYDYLEAGLDLIEAPQPGPVFAVWGATGAIGIWFWMLTSYFKRPPVNRRVLWGWLLIIGSYAAASIYFLFIYLPQRSTE